MKSTIILFILLVSSISFADECVPPTGGVCLTADEKKKIKDAVEELDRIKKSPATVEFATPIEIVQDWDGRTYINGGTLKPLMVKIKISDVIDRDLAVTLPTKVYYRENPPDPMFRLRIRAQAGVLANQVVKNIEGDKQTFWDAQLSFDFFHVGNLNVNAAAGVRSWGIGPGLDLTKNFGVVGQYAMIYDGFKSTAFAGCYFSF